MDTDYKAFLLPMLVLQHEQYTQAFRTYKAAVSEESPGRKAWTASLDTEPFENAMFFTDGTHDLAAASDDPAEVLAILQRLDSVRARVKEYLDGMYAAAMHRENTGRLDNVPTADELQSLLKTVRTTLKSYDETFVAQGHLTRQDMVEALGNSPEGESYVWDRPVKGNATTFSYRPEGSVKVKSADGTRTSRVEGPRSNSKRIRLVVDGTVSPAGLQLAESCQKLGITTKELQDAIVAAGGKSAWTDDRSYTTNMVTINGHTLGLYLDNGSK